MTREKCCAWLGAGKGHPKEATCQVRPEGSPGTVQVRGACGLIRGSEDSADASGKGWVLHK